MEKYWVEHLNLPSHSEFWVYTSLLTDLQSNKLKEYRFKLINAALPCKQLLFKWKLIDNPLCEICKITENYNHLFIECPAVQQVWKHAILSLKNAVSHTRLSI